jgi:hypothetical protein
MASGRRRQLEETRYHRLYSTSQRPTVGEIVEIFHSKTIIVPPNVAEIIFECYIRSPRPSRPTTVLRRVRRTVTFRSPPPTPNTGYPRLRQLQTVSRIDIATGHAHVRRIRQARRPATAAARERPSWEWRGTGDEY